ncbi:hypothetical protein DMH04_41235 [Kibdelosporangium aridum]|uniref:Uncharacterized protein n=1 Tax=Kibdelosporangium aridum TaxID=2030 RepID=A0A428YUQ4_KIBAR|nr:hypothetical protein [Kibdelosporangium aridum]RSM73438.1 hypothetical protein DMH04_41235 [Kibdelosporangium aridum]
MGNIVFNVAKGRIAHYASLPATNDAIVVVPLENSGLEADSVLEDYDTLAAILAGASNEQTTVGRKTVTVVTVTVDDTNNRVNIDMGDLSWLTPSGNQIGALVFCYEPDTTGGTDSDLIPLTKQDWVITPEGDEIKATVADFARAT